MMLDVLVGKVKSEEKIEESHSKLSCTFVLKRSSHRDWDGLQMISWDGKSPRYCRFINKNFYVVFVFKNLKTYSHCSPDIARWKRAVDDR
jgi:hypothetical protein